MQGNSLPSACKGAMRTAPSTCNAPLPTAFICRTHREGSMAILGAIIIGFLAGIIAS